MARRLLPAAILIPIVLGYFRLEGQRLGMFGTEMGLSLMVVLTAVISIVFVLKFAAGANREEAAKTQGNEILNAILRSPSEGVTVVNAAGQMVLQNDSAEAMAGKKQPLSTADSWSLMMPPEK